MAIRRYQPWGLLNELSEELSRLYEGQGAPDASSAATSDWVPAVDVRELQDRYVIDADLPGVRPEDIDIQMENGILSLSGTRTTEAAADEGGARRVERARGSFFRRFSLPDTADAERISARSDNGVLQISIPKQEKVKPRRIEVQG